MTGVVIGRYRLVEEVGRGGMGTVYRAERADGAFEQVVALKLLRHDIDTDALHEQLRTERQLLAHVDHPNIARLLDGGRAPDGRPYLVMEYVEGTPLDVYCTREELTLDERLDLFLTVCAAVQHVHGPLVVHQDLKPGNILVSAEGHPRLLDFGIARLSTVETIAAPGAHAVPRFLTPEYAAPEQRRGAPPTTATDVYQLGVLLCELLTGRRPFPRRGAAGADAGPEVPTPPSRLAGSGPPSFARYQRRLAGDLDAIVLKAIDDEPDLRYGSVAELAEDVRRYRTRRPVLARPTSRAYRMSRFARRHRAGLIAAAAVFLGTVAFSINILVQSARVARERDRAEQVSVMLMDLIAGADPLYGSDTLTLGAFFDRSTRRVEGSRNADPLLQAALLTALPQPGVRPNGRGSVHYNLTRLEDAERVWTQALDLAGAESDDGVVLGAELQVLLSKVRVDQGRRAEADSLVREALGTLERSGEQGAGILGRALAQGAFVQQVSGALDSARVLYLRALPVLDTTTADGARSAAVVYLNLGYLEQGRGDIPAARTRFREALRLRERAFGPESPSNANVWEALAVASRNGGQLDSADVASARALEISSGALPAPNRVIASNMHVRAQVLARLGRIREADSLYAGALSMTETLYGTGSAATASISNNYAVFLERSGDEVRALDLFGRAVEAYRAGFGADHAYTAIVEANHARLLGSTGSVPEATAAFRRALEVLEETDFDPALAAPGAGRRVVGTGETR